MGGEEPRDPSKDDERLLQRSAVQCRGSCPGTEDRVPRYGGPVLTCQCLLYPRVYKTSCTAPPRHNPIASKVIDCGEQQACQKTS